MSIKKITKIALTGAAAAAGAATLKKNGFCAACAAKRLISALQVHEHTSSGYGNGAALTPPMGWASWNLFRHNINEDLIRDTARAMRDSGLAQLGYTYVNIDDCWQSSRRTPEGKLQSDLRTFPSGIKSLVADVNAMGLKLGIYSSNGTYTCEDLPASLGNEAIDADTFAEWGVEYLKYDFCHNKTIPTVAPQIEKITVSKPGSSEGEDYTAEQAELRGTARLFKDEKLPTGSYVSGLCAGGGSIIFDDVAAEADGEYILTLGLHKSGLTEKYAEIVVNGEDVYPVRIPGTKAVTKEGKNQLTIRLNAGENQIMIHNPVGSRMDSAAKQYKQMGLELKRASRELAERTGEPVKPIVYSICEWGFNKPYLWGAEAGNLWRTTLDIFPAWGSIVMIYEMNVRLWKYSAPGAWNDPDMLEVGVGKLTDDENRAHFSLWCMLTAPLIIGCDLRSFVLPDGKPDTGNKTLAILSNKAAIDIDQDERGIQCRRIKTNGLVDILAKPLAGKELAVCIFNKGSTEATAGVKIKNLIKEGFIDLPESASYSVYDIWDDTSFISEDEIGASLPGHSVKLYRIKAMN